MDRHRGYTCKWGLYPFTGIRPLPVVMDILTSSLGRRGEGLSPIFCRGGKRRLSKKQMV